MIFAAIASLTLWYAMALCFFFNIDEGNVVLMTMLILSPINNDVSSSGTPNILSLYLASMTNSTATLAATNSEPYVDVSTVFCLLVYQISGVLFTHRRIPVTDLHVTLSLAWSAST